MRSPRPRRACRLVLRSVEVSRQSVDNRPNRQNGVSCENETFGRRWCSSLETLILQALAEVFMVLRVNYLVVTIVLLFSIACFFERPAYGYVDPGSSLLMFQSISAFVTGALFYFRRRLKRLFIKPRSGSGESRNSL